MNDSDLAMKDSRDAFEDENKETLASLGAGS